MKNLPLLCFAFLLLISCRPAHTYFYVSADGNDNNTGTHKNPFKTLQKAQNSIRMLPLAEREKQIIVRIDKGIYKLDDPLIFGPEDSAPEKGSVIFSGMPGKNVEISGGNEIKNWEKRSDGIWVAKCSLPENYDFRELFIDDNRAVRARHPDEGFLRIAKAGEDRRTNFYFNRNDFPLPENPSEVELVLLHDWSITRIGLSGIDSLQHIITAKDSIGAKTIDFFKIDNWEKNPRYFLENSMAFLDAENEYFYNRKEGLVYLKLKEGESPEGKKIVIPALSSGLLRLTGYENNKIRNIRFENITFSYCSWPLPADGYAGIQACYFDPRGKEKDKWDVVPAAVEGEFCENCSFVSCRFLHLGGSGLWLGTGAENCLISGCHFEDISGNGIMIGEGNDRTVGGELWWKKTPSQAASGNRIEKSTVRACGKQFFGAVGIWCGLAARTSILNNQISDLPYTGIS
ncbi:MAG: right-handed parallel beta-helix repeat-containing protein, partial [Methanococcaceae archaeon]